MKRTLTTVLTATALSLSLAACGMMMEDERAETAAAMEPAAGAPAETMPMVTAADLNGAQAVDSAGQPVGEVALAQFGGDRSLDQVIVTLAPGVGQEEARVLIPGDRADVVMRDNVPIVQIGMTAQQIQDLAQAAPNEPTG